MIGDQQASAFGCGCVKNGLTKATLGTGLFIDAFMGSQVIPKIRDQSYPLIGWKSGPETSHLYETRSDFAHTHIQDCILNGNVKNVKSLDNIALFGDNQGSNSKISQESAIKLFNKAILEFYKVWTEFNDNVGQIIDISSIKIDGGYSHSDYLLQGISSVSNKKVVRMLDSESTSRGAYFLARLGAGLSPPNTDFSPFIHHSKEFYPNPQQTKYFHELLKNIPS
uniref:Putative glycerol kinase 5 (Trinotate prediction) n=1 Tax=Myxobolus squamalis TaxID=59785 RepID=A0A6B2FZC5_MYXSQ